MHSKSSSFSSSSSSSAAAAGAASSAGGWWCGCWCCYKPGLPSPTFSLPLKSALAFLAAVKQPNQTQTKTNQKQKQKQNSCPQTVVPKQGSSQTVPVK